jgi:D-alanyl-D-alanine carboxypeptidase (penicillin-binding protein 5/6)
MRLIAVVMGTASENARARESEKLLSYGFRFFETHKLYAADKALKTMRIWKGATDSLALGLKKPLYVTVPRGRYDSLNASLTVENSIIAPAHKGQQFGTVNVQLGEDTLAKRPLVALQDVREGGLWQRMVDNVMLLFQ